MLSSPGWTRTNDLVVNSHPLYQLSYRGIRRNARSGTGPHVRAQKIAHRP